MERNNVYHRKKENEVKVLFVTCIISCEDTINPKLSTLG